MSITPVYAALLTFVYLVLTWRVISYRRANLISLGDNDDKALRKRMRAQANCIEYVPLGLILMILTEAQNVPPLALHAMGVSLLLGRVLHAVGFSATPQKMILRQAGMVLTLTMLALSALALLGHALV